MLLVCFVLFVACCVLVAMCHLFVLCRRDASARCNDVVGVCSTSFAPNCYNMFWCVSSIVRQHTHLCLCNCIMCARCFGVCRKVVCIVLYPWCYVFLLLCVAVFCLLCVVDMCLQLVFVCCVCFSGCMSVVFNVFVFRVTYSFFRHCHAWCELCVCCML